MLQKLVRYVKYGSNYDLQNLLETVDFENIKLNAKTNNFYLWVTLCYLSCY